MEGDAGAVKLKKTKKKQG